MKIAIWIDNRGSQFVKICENSIRLFTFSSTSAGITVEEMAISEKENKSIQKK